MLKVFVTQPTREWDSNSSYVLFTSNVSEARLKAIEVLGLDPADFTIEEYEVHTNLILKADGYDYACIEKVDLDLEDDKEVA